MAASVSPEVQILHEICDTIDSDHPAPRTLDAGLLLGMMSTKSLAFDPRSTARLEELVECFRQCEQENLLYPENESEKLMILLREWYINIDELFFFDTLTRQVDTKSGRQLVFPFAALKEHSGHWDIFNNQPNMDNHLGGFMQGETRTIVVYLKTHYPNGDGTYTTLHRPAVDILHTIVHEAVHAFLYIFADSEHPLYEEEVLRQGGHGTVFRNMFRVITDKIQELTGSQKWKDLVDDDPVGPKGDAEKGFPPLYDPRTGTIG